VPGAGGDFRGERTMGELLEQLNVLVSKIDTIMVRL
jgi:hypothetical protein